MPAQLVFPLLAASLAVALPAGAAPNDAAAARREVRLRGTVFRVSPSRGYLVFIGQENRRYLVHAGAAEIRLRGSRAEDGLERLRAGDAITVRGAVQVF